ncbi:rhamnulokinase [Hamadaea tsunoensis]|uniref:rhamnulokinase n=1 Tax=Hamadaea tsunoensis TaxID=53368 RepID=UPI00041C1118|nr:rhamnulokinase family protein [Hamadaea tsunoensis]
MNTTIAAVDLGATSGRVILGRLVDGVLHTEHITRFGNEPVHTLDGMHWNLLNLHRRVLAGLAAAERSAPGEIASVGIDSWAVDYALLHDGRVLGNPYHYRDARNDAGVRAVHDRIGAAELYQRNGLQHLPFNTVFQLSTEGALLEFADQMLLIPDLFTFWLTGRAIAERTNASTTGLLDPRSLAWDLDLADTLGIPSRILPPLVDPGTPVGVLTPQAAAAVGRALPIVTVGSHDTASAVAAIPNTGRDFAYISCGTWGLVGLELDGPVLTEHARQANFTNEGGLDETNRFLHNVMGLWLLSESLRHWEPAATDARRASALAELLDAAAKVDEPLAIFDVNDPIFLPPGDIPHRVETWCRDHDQPVPRSRPVLIRAIIESLAEAFAHAVHDAARLADHEVTTIHIVGGGSQNTLLCQATANRSGLPVVAGPVEATAMGNMLVQARALGALGPDLRDIRAVAAASSNLTRYLPR